MTHHDELIETGSLHDTASLERRVRHLGYEVTALRRKVCAMSNMDEIEALAKEILRLENFRDEFESLKNSL